MKLDLAAVNGHNGVRALGAVGSMALAIGGYGAGALPKQDTGAILSWLRDLGRHPGLGVFVAYFGLFLLLAAWWRLLSHTRTAQGSSTRSLLVTLAIWGAPLLLAPPLFSRDIYSYLVQGAMVLAGTDVYHAGPASFGGVLSVEVPGVWQHTPSPYGPAFLAIAAAVVTVTSTKVVAGILALRLVAIAAIGLLAAVLPGLARRCGVDPAAALVLGVLNPLVLLHLVAGAHNDAIMLGLLVAGLAAASKRRVGVAAALVTLATLVKAPAALGLLAVIELCAQDRVGRLRAAATTGVMAAATVVAVTALAGTGYGWLTALTTPASPHSWSLSHVLGQITAALFGVLDRNLIRLAQPIWTWVCTGAAAVAVLAAWRYRKRLGTVYALGLSLSAVALLGPATRPWYLLWGLIPIAAAAPDGRVRHIAAVISGVFALAVLPDGEWPSLASVGLAVQGGLLAVLTVTYLSQVEPLAVWFRFPPAVPDPAIQPVQHEQA